MTSQFSAYSLDAGKAKLCAHTSMHTPTHPVTYPRKRAHARTHTETNMYSFCFSTETMIPESASILRYTYTVCLLQCCCQMLKLYTFGGR